MAYLDYEFQDTPEQVAVFDEAPLWSAAFGLLLLRYLSLKPAMTVVDIGSGTGFPLMELAGRLGASSTLYGVDSWKNASSRARQKIAQYGQKNVHILELSAEEVPLPDACVDLIVSNLGVNNFERPQAVMQECARLLKPGGIMAITSNLDGHWRQFYRIFEAVLRQLNKKEALSKLKAQQRHRGSIKTIMTLFEGAGLSVIRTRRQTMHMDFIDGTAFLHHPFVQLGWLSSWITLINREDRPLVFSTLEAQLNGLAQLNGVLKLTVPMAYVEGRK